MPRRESSSAAGSAAHPDGTEVDPRPGGTPSRQASAAAGGLDDVAAIAVGGQQHGMVCLDEDGDGRTPGAAVERHQVRAGRHRPDRRAGRRGRWTAWAEAVGSVPVASFTVTKLRWLADHEPDTPRAPPPSACPTTTSPGGSPAPRLDALVTDRGDASGTGYWSPPDGRLPRRTCSSAPSARTRCCRGCSAPAEPAGQHRRGQVLGPGTGDNAAAALGLGAEPGDVVVSIGTSGVACAVADDAGARRRPAPWPGSPTRPAGSCRWSRPSTPRGSSMPPRGCWASTTTSCPGSRCPRRPARTAWSSCPTSRANAPPTAPTPPAPCTGCGWPPRHPAHLARAAVEGLLCGLADGVDAVERRAPRSTG